jgi:hypothetical protein
MITNDDERARMEEVRALAEWCHENSLCLNFNNFCLLKKVDLAHKTLTNFYRCNIESILSGYVTTCYGNCTARNRWVFPEGGAVCPTHHRGHTAYPPGHLQYLLSQKGQEDHQGPQPPEQWLVHSVTIQKAGSVQVYQSQDRETEIYHESLKVSSSAITKTIKRYEETGSHEDRHRKKRPRVTFAAEDNFIRGNYSSDCSSNKCFTKFK